MPRTEIPFVVQTQSGGVVQGASIQVNNRVGGGASVIYAAETGSSTLPNPVTTGLSGRVDGWLEEGQYTLVVSGPGITAYSQPWDVRSGGPISRYGSVAIGNIGPASQGGIGLGPDPSDTVFYRTGIAQARLNGGLTIDGSASVGQALLVGTALSFAIQDSTGSGLLKTNLATAFADSANVPRLEVGNNVANNDAFVSGLTGVALRRLGIGAQGVVLANAIATGLPIPTTDSLRVEYAGGRDTLHLASTAAETGITIGGDVEVYRSAANVLKTSDTFDALAFRQNGVALASTHLGDATNIGLLDSARTWTAIQTHTADVLHQSADVRVRQSGDTFDKIRLGWDGLIYFGSGAAAYDVTLRRTGVGVLHSSGTLDAATSMTANIGGTNQVALGVASAGLVLGLAGDTNLYRSSANVLMTDDTFYAAGAVVAAVGGGTAQVQMGAIGPAGSAAIILGDVTLRRSATSNITLDGDLRVTNLFVSGAQTNIGDQTSVGPLVAAFGLVGQVRLGSDPTGNPTIAFGTAEDTTLYRDGANKLHTGDALQVDGVLTATAGAVISGASLTLNRTTGTNETLAAQTAGVSRLRILANGTIEWADTAGVADTTAQLVRTGSGVLGITGAINAVSYQVGGAALASTHLADSTGLARLATPTFTGTVTVPVLSVSTREELPAGTFAAPSQTFTGDADTGLYSPGANQIGITTGGVSRFTIGGDGTVAVVGTLTVGGLTPVFTNDARLGNSRTPSGPAGGELSGTYPNPAIAPGIVTNAHISATAAIADTKLATIATLGKIADSAIPSTIARVASPTFTGTPTGPTAAVNTNNTQLATTAFVIGQASDTVPIMNGSVALGTSLRYARQDHIHAIDTSRAPLASPAFIGIPTVDGTNIVLTNDTRLNDQRTPIDLSVGTGKIVDLAVTTAKLANLSVTEAKLANSSVTEAKLASRVILSVLPGSPVDGQEILFQTSAMIVAGVSPWAFRYRAGSSSGFKWEFIGGSAWVVNVETSENASVFGAWGDFSSGPDLLLPHAGDYLVNLGARLTHSQPGAGIQLTPVATGLAAPAIVSSSSIGAVQFRTAASDGGSGIASVCRRVVCTGISGLLKLQYFANTSGASSSSRFIDVTPIRIG